MGESWGLQQCLRAESRTLGILNTSSTGEEHSLTLSHTLYSEMPPPPLLYLTLSLLHLSAFIIPFRAASSHLCFTCLSHSVSVVGGVFECTCFENVALRMLDA